MLHHLASSLGLSVQAQARSAATALPSHQGDCRRSGSLRLPADSCPLAKIGLVRELQARVPPLPRDGPLAAPQTPQKTQVGCSQANAPRTGCCQCEVVNGFRVRRSLQRQAVQSIDHRRHIHAGMPCHRSRRASGANT